MQETFIEIFGNWGYLVLPVLSGIVISFLAEAMDYYTPQGFKWGYSFLIISVGISILVNFTFEYYFDNIPEFILLFIMNIAVGLVFYKLAGKTFVARTISKLDSFLAKKTDETANKL